MKTFEIINVSNNDLLSKNEIDNLFGSGAGDKYVPLANDFIRNYCDRYFSYGQFRETFYGSQNTLFLQEMNIKSIDKVTIDDVETTNYELINSMLLLKDYIGYINAKIVVEYTSGYVIIPAEIQEAGKLYINDMISIENQIRSDITSQRVGEVSMNYKLFQTIERLLLPWRNIR